MPKYISVQDFRSLNFTLQKVDSEHFLNKEEDFFQNDVSATVYYSAEYAAGTVTLELCLVNSGDSNFDFDGWEISQYGDSYILEMDGEKLRITDDGEDGWTYCVTTQEIEKFFDCLDVSFLEKEIPEEFFEEVDMTAQENFKQYTLNNDNGPRVRFKGVCIGTATSKDPYGKSEEVGRWTELELYRTAGGKFIAHRIGATEWQGEHYRFATCVCTTEKEVIDFFGHGWLAKELYDDAAIEDVSEVD